MDGCMASYASRNKKKISYRRRRKKEKENHVKLEEKKEKPEESTDVQQHQQHDVHEEKGKEKDEKTEQVWTLLKEQNRHLDKLTSDLDTIEIATLEMKKSFLALTGGKRFRPESDEEW